MLDPDLISARIYQASPDGRLERLEAVLQEMADGQDDADTHHFRKYVEWAREARFGDRLNDVLLYIAKAEHALTLIDYADDPDRICGVKIRDGARKGGDARKSGAVEAVLAEMKRLKDTGGSISWAAQTARKNGFGTSADANHRLWYRYRKKD